MYVRERINPWGWENYLRDKVVSRHRSREGYKKNSGALNVYKSTVASIILKWKRLWTTNILLTFGHPIKLSYQGWMALSRQATKNARVTIYDIPSNLVDKKETYRRTTITWALHQSGLYSSSGQPEAIPQRAYNSLLGVSQKAPEFLSDKKKQNPLIWRHNSSCHVSRKSVTSPHLTSPH